MQLRDGLGYCLVNGNEKIELFGVTNYNMEQLDTRCPWVTVDRLSSSQYPRWALVGFTYLDGDHSGGDVNVYIVVADEQGYTEQVGDWKWKRPKNPIDGMTVVQQNGGITNLKTNTNNDGLHHGEVDFAQSGDSSFDPAKQQVGPYSVVIKDTKGGLPSEKVYGLGLPLRRHVVYVLYFQKVLSAAPPPIEGHVEIKSVLLEPTALSSTEPYGTLVKVTMTVYNGTNAVMQTQEPAPAFKYVEGQTFQSIGKPEVKGTFRVALDFEGREGIDHPYRWGLGAPLALGQTTTVTGYVELHKASVKKYWAGLVKEQEAWIQDHIGEITVTVTEAPPEPPPDDNPDLAELTAKVNALVARIAAIEANQAAQGAINGDVGRALAELQAFEAQIRAL